MATAAELYAANAIIPRGEVWQESDTKLRKGGPDADGIQTWRQLPYEGSGNLRARQFDPDDLGGTASDASVAALVTSTSATSSALKLGFSALQTVDIRRFLSGQPVPNDGVLDASTALQAAVDYIGTNGLTAQVVVPEGRWRINTKITWRTGAGLKGAGQSATVFLPQGLNSFIEGYANGDVPPDLGGAATVYSDCVFEDFTVDASGQTGSSLSVKGIFIQFMKRARFARVTIRNTLGTGFGMDYLQDSVAVDCRAEGCGRSAVSDTGAGAGFGVATGYYDIEGFRLINCQSVNNRTAGFFTENKSSGPTKYPLGFVMDGCTASGNAEGFRDAGSSGALVSGCTFTGNKNGVAVGPTPANTNGGHHGTITGCIIASNSEMGVQIERIATNGYLIERNIIRLNTQRGVNRGSTSSVTGVTIRANQVSENGETGIGVIATNAPVAKWTVIDNDVTDNGTNAAAGPRDGIAFYSDTTGLTVRNNRCYNSVGATQQRGIDIRGSARTSVLPIIQGNDVRGNVITADPLRVQHIVADATQVTANITA